MKNLRQPQFTVFIMVIFLFILTLLIAFDNQGMKDLREQNQKVELMNIEANKARNDKFCELYTQEFRITQAPPAYKHCFEEAK